MHAVTNYVLPGKISTENKTGMGTVKDADLAFFIRCYIRHNMYIDSGFLERKLGRKPFRSFDIPNTEHFAYIKQSILIAVFLFKLLYLFCITNASRYDTVNKCRTE